MYVTDMKKRVKRVPDPAIWKKRLMECVCVCVARVYDQGS